MKPALSTVLPGRFAAPLLPALLLLLGSQLHATVGSQGDPDESAEAGVVSKAGPVLALTLEGALRLALENNLDLEIAEISTETARFDALGSWGAFDPIANLNVGYTESDSQSQNLGTSSSSSTEATTESLGAGVDWPLLTGGNFSLVYSRRLQETDNTFVPVSNSILDVVAVSMTQPLLRGAWRRYATGTQRQAELTHEREAANERLIRQQMVLDVENAYWDLVSSHEELGVRLLAEDLGQGQLEQDTARFEVGTGTEVDVLQSETNLAQQKESTLEARHILSSAEDSLRRLLFQKPEEEAGAFFDEWDWAIDPLTALPDPAAGGEEPLIDWRVSMRRAIQWRPELGQSRLDIQVSEVNLELARSNRKPQLDLTISGSSAGFGGDHDESFQQASGFDFPTYTASLVFSTPIRNRTALQALRAARENVRRQRLVYDRMELDVLAQIRTATRDVRYRWESVGAARLSLDLAKRQLEAEEARYANDLSTTFQVLEFQRDLASALSAEHAASAAFAKARAALLHAEGRASIPAGAASSAR